MRALAIITTDFLRALDRAVAWRRIRLGALLAALLLLYFWARQSAWLTDIDPRTIRELVRQWGNIGVLAYALAFCVGLLLYVPGTIFIVAAGLIYGPLWGSLLAYCAGNIAVFVSFNLVRWLGGNAKVGGIHPWLAARLDRLEQLPVRTVAFLRIFLWTAPALNYFLALTEIKQHQHLLGTLLGTLAPVMIIAITADWMLVSLFDK